MEAADGSDNGPGTVVIRSLPRNQEISVSNRQKKDACKPAPFHGQRKDRSPIDLDENNPSIEQMEAEVAKILEEDGNSTEATSTDPVQKYHNTLHAEDQTIEEMEAEVDGILHSGTRRTLLPEHKRCRGSSRIMPNAADSTTRSLFDRNKRVEVEAGQPVRSTVSLPGATRSSVRFQKR